VRWCSLRRRSGVRGIRHSSGGRAGCGQIGCREELLHLQCDVQHAGEATDGFAKQCAARPGHRSEPSTAPVCDLELDKLEVVTKKADARNEPAS
jgi:hypothetical protein